MKKMLIACGMLRDELGRVMVETGCTLPVHWMEGGLHDAPDRLGGALQQQVDHYSGAYDALLLAYGFCGGALDGLVSAHAKLVLPLVHDCIQLLLCRQEGQNPRRPDTLYFTQAWTESQRFIGNEYKLYRARLGARKAQRDYRALFKAYRGMNLVDTGCYDLERAAASVRPAAEHLNLTYGVVPGTIQPLKELLLEQWDSHFYVAEPGEPLSLSTFLKKSSAFS